MTSEDKYVLNAEWFDQQACLNRQFYIQYYPSDGAIDIVSDCFMLLFQFDIKLKRPFLKRTKLSHVKDTDLFVGSILTVYARQFKIVGFADTFTQVNLDKLFDRTFMIIKPKAMYEQMGLIVQDVQMAGFRISNA